MTIYWERCSICGKYMVTLECTLNPQDFVCPHCCVLFCSNRVNLCSNPVWYRDLGRKIVSEKAITRKKEKEKIEKVLTDLLKKLEK